MIDRRCFIALLGLVFLQPPPSAVAQPAAFTIADIMLAPYPSNLVASSQGHSVAWVYDIKGCRNIWVAQDHSGMKPRQITSYTLDDGFDIGELAWSPDGSELAYTRGGYLDDDVPVNVSSSPQGPSAREVWVVASKDGTPQKVGSGHAAIFSPDGHRLVFIDKETLWTAPPDAASAPTPLIVDQGQIMSVTFSQDSKRLAFVSARPGHALLGIYEFAAKTIVWMSPSLDQDTSPTFSPSGASIAFIRIPTEKTPEFVSRRVGQPWSIWIADVATGRARRAWVADSGAGSVFQPTLSSNNVLWTAHGDLVFPWEKTGWLQLYTVAAEGGRARPVTGGQFEVVHMALAHDRSRIVYSSNQDDSDRIHVWTAALDSGSPTLAGKDHAIEDYAAISGDGTIFALRSDATQPLQPVMLVGNARWEPLAPDAIPTSFPASKLAVPESVVFAAKDDHTVHAQLFLQHHGGNAKMHPAIMFFHGGPRRQMLLGFHPMSAYSWMYALNQYFASQGYVVISVNYRGGIGYGRDYREAEGFGPDGASEINDLLGAIKYLQARKDVDPKRIGIWGGSYGGLMTALGLARASKDIAAGVDYAGVYNWATLLPSLGTPFDSGDASRRAFESSPAASIEQWRSPVLVVQADNDMSVPPQQSSELIEALNSHHIEHDELVLPNEIHDLARYSSWMALFDAADAYFGRYLR